MKTIYTIIFSILLISCGTRDKQPGSAVKSQNDTNSSLPLNCYKYEGESDTIVLKLIHVGKSITGTLVYKLKEKDKNMGTIQGYMKGNILVADYTFMSEGTQSIRQVAFKQEGDGFTEGYGDIVNENDKPRFRNLDSLTFNASVKLSACPCK